MDDAHERDAGDDTVAAFIPFVQFSVDSIHRQLQLATRTVHNDPLYIDVDDSTHLLRSICG